MTIGELLYRGNFRAQIDGRRIFSEKTFAGCTLVPPKDPTPPNFAEKLARIAIKPRFFPPSKVYRYTVYIGVEAEWECRGNVVPCDDLPPIF